MKRIVFILPLLFFLFSCKKDAAAPDLTLKEITLSEQTLQLPLGSSHNLTVTFSPANATSATLSWASTNEEVVQVNGEGRLEAKKIGDAIITAKNGDGTISSSCKVTVTPILAADLVLDKTSLVMIIGTKDKLNVRFVPSNTTNQKVLWVTSDSLIIKIDELGNIEAMKTGKAMVTAKTEDGIASATCSIEVRLPSLTGLDIDKKNLSVIVGEEVQFTAISTPPNANPEEMLWSSSDETIATISSKGLATTLKVGKTTIKVTNKSGLISASTELNVSAVKVQSIKFNTSSITLAKGANTKIEYTISPANATDKTVMFISANTAIASVNASGAVIGLTEGETSITLSSKDGAATAKIDVRVTPIKVASITLNKTNIKMLPGESQSVTATVLPTNAANRQISWKSSNPSVATVDQTGIIKSVSVGQAVVTATTSDGGLSATCTVDITTIDKMIRIAAKPNRLVVSNTGNTSELSVGIYNPTASPIKIKFIRIYVNNILSKSYSVGDPDLSLDAYLYRLGPFALGSGLIDMSNFMNGWTVKFEYENNGVMYQNTVAVLKNQFGDVTFSDLFGGSSAQSRSNKRINPSLRKGSSIRLLN